MRPVVRVEHCPWDSLWKSRLQYADAKRHAKSEYQRLSFILHIFKVRYVDVFIFSNVGQRQE